MSNQQSPLLLKGIGDDLIVAGYASVELVDKQGDLITTGALDEAFGKFMDNAQCRNVQLAHSNIQVGEVVPEYTDSSGRLWKSEVDDSGMFVVIRLRSDIEKAREVASEVRKGNLKSFSIGGQAFERVSKSSKERGSYREIRRMELHEVTICEKGINPEAQFRILKQDDEKMTETEVVTQLHDVLERLSKKLDDAESDGDDKGGFPFDKPSKDKDSKDKDKDDSKDKDDKDDDKEKMAYSDEEVEKGFDDVISTEYLQWLESTVKGAGYDTNRARSQFEKGYGPGQSGFDHRGQGSLEGAGEGESSKRPKMDFGSGGSGNKFAIRASADPAPTGSKFVIKENVSGAQLEEAYSVYKAARAEQEFKGELGGAFDERYTSESTQKSNEDARQSFDSRAPLENIQKAVLALNERIDNLSSGSGETITKSATRALVEVPSSDDLADMSWDDVHRLAAGALRGGE
jgi:HK97 family phage prohead protease